MNIEKVIKKLSEKRKIFHSEADLQFALAWQIKSIYKEANIRLEYCPAQFPKMHIDILVDIFGKIYPIELKYKNRKIDIKRDGEEYHLKDQSAQDIGRYDYLADVSRIEAISDTLPNYEKGYAIFLTNDHLYWKKPARTNTCYENFRIDEEQKKIGSMSWAVHTGAGTKKNREKNIILKNEYITSWRNYSFFDGYCKNNILKYLILTIPSVK